MLTSVSPFAILIRNRRAWFTWCSLCLGVLVVNCRCEPWRPPHGRCYNGPLRSLVASLLLVLPLAAQKTVLVVSAGSGDYLMAAGGTLASLIDRGFAVHVVQFGNDEKNSIGLSPAQTRLANNTETDHAARMQIGRAHV